MLPDSDRVPTRAVEPIDSVVVTGPIQRRLTFPKSCVALR